MATSADKGQDKLVFDVAKPGKSLPTATSRPVIASKGPMLKDPMVSDKSEGNSPNEEKKLVKTTAKKITPLSQETAQPVDTTADTAEGKPPEATTAESKQEDQPDTDSEKAPETTTAEPDKKSEEGASTGEDQKASAEAEAVNAVADQAAQNKKGSGPSEEELARQKELEAMIEEEKYFVPIGQVTRRKNARRLLAGLLVFVVLAAVGGYAAIDAGLLEVSVELPFDLIQEL